MLDGASELNFEGLEVLGFCADIVAGSLELDGLVVEGRLG